MLGNTLEGVIPKIEQEVMQFTRTLRTAGRESHCEHRPRQTQARTWLDSQGIQGTGDSDPAKLVKTLKAWKTKANGCSLVFPTAGCKPKIDLLDCLKAVAELSELDPKNFWLTNSVRLLPHGHRGRESVCGQSAMVGTLGHRIHDALSKALT
jgi:hypothetical protein